MLLASVRWIIALTWEWSANRECAISHVTRNFFAPNRFFCSV